MDVEGVECGNVNTTHLVQDKDQWWVFMNRAETLLLS
jgi:hypothetical protein